MQPAYMEPLRIQKFIADSGLCSRRAAEALIVSGGVYVNGQKATLGQKVEPGTEINRWVEKCRA